MALILFMEWILEGEQKTLFFTQIQNNEKNTTHSRLDPISNRLQWP